MLKSISIALLILTFFFPQFDVEAQQFSIKRDESFPKWLKSCDYLTDQTSGITFIGEDGIWKKFIICDDIGKLHHLRINSKNDLKLSPIYFSESVQSYLATFPKLDFEEIVYDKYENKFYLSIEGNTEDYEKFVGIYLLQFNSNMDSVLRIEKLQFKPIEKFLQFTAWNIGYEGVAVDSNYFYLGLEGFQPKNVFTDSAIIFIYDKKSKELVGEINTKVFGIGSITGLFSKNSNEVWGIDRNNRKIFFFKLDEQLNISFFQSVKFEPVIPEYKNLNYIGSYESIVIDNDDNLYIIDDPWGKFFVPPDDIISKLDAETIKYFKSFLPIIDKFKVTQFEE